MNSLRLKNRIVFIQKTGGNKVSKDGFSNDRRGKNYINMEETSSEIFTDIFDVESEFSDLNKSNELFKNIEDNSGKNEVIE
jgi:hypothetical protein